MYFKIFQPYIFIDSQNILHNLHKISKKRVTKNHLKNSENFPQKLSSALL